MNANANVKEAADVTVVVLSSDSGTGTDADWVQPLREYFGGISPMISISCMICARASQTFDHERFDVSVIVRDDMDLACGLNFLIASLRSEFVLWADPSWACSFESLNPKWMHACIEALRTDTKFSQVKLHNDDALNFQDRSLYIGPICQCLQAPFYIQSPRKILGGITLKPAMTRVSALRGLGPLREAGLTNLAEIEAEYCARSSITESYLTLRSPALTPFVPKFRPAFTAGDLTIEPP